MPELDCQQCGAPLEEDEELEHRTCTACMYTSGDCEDIEAENTAIEENRVELLTILEKSWE